MKNSRVIIQTFRPPFLMLTPICLYLAIRLAQFNGIEVDVTVALLALTAAVLAHISVNALNEYADFKSGLDFKTKKTPFSGGSGTLPQHPELAVHAKWLGILALTITALIGLYFVLRINMQVLWFGLIGIAIVISYTTQLNRLPVLCLLAPGIGFSTIMVLGTYLLFSPEWSELVFFVSIIPFLQINNLLLLNQYPDIEADQTIGRRTFPIAYGVAISNIMFLFNALIPYLLVIGLVTTEQLPRFSLLSLLTIPLMLTSVFGAFKLGANIGKQPRYLAANVACALLTPLILALTLSS